MVEDDYLDRDLRSELERRGPANLREAAALTGRLGRRASRSLPSTTTIRSSPARNASAI